MRIRHFSVRGFGTLDDLELKDLNDFNVFVGENNTGKSNILDALHVFVSNIYPLNVSTSTSHPDELWPGAMREKNIKWTAEFDFTNDEFTGIIQRIGLNVSRESSGWTLISNTESGFQLWLNTLAGGSLHSGLVTSLDMKQ